MKLDTDLMARLQAATQKLMTDGPMAATAAIQQALAGDAPPHDAPNDAEPAPSAPTMKDLNPPPEHAKEHATSRRKERAAPKAPPRMPDVAALLAKAGIALPEGLPAGLSPGNLPGGRKRPPPAPLPDGARFDSASYTCHAGTRGYKLYVPSTYAGQPVPLIVMLHGCTQDPDDFAAGTRMNQVAEETGCLVAYPAQSQQANSSKCWNWFSAADQRRDRGEPAIIAGIARQVMATHAVDPARVAIAGLSAGGAMAIVVASQYPDLFRAVGVHSGLAAGSAGDLPSALQAMQRGGAGDGGACPPLIVFHGDKDKTVHPSNGRHVLRHGVADGAAGETERGKAPGGRRYTRTVHQDSAGRLVAEHWELHGAGHAWAGGSASGSYTDPTGPDASRAMVRFFDAVAGR
jgi:poly(hydroxyalkanoate) depolymerase family esterase